MPQNKYMDIFHNLYGQQLNHDDNKRKKKCRYVHVEAEYARKAVGIKGKLFSKKRLVAKTTLNLPNKISKIDCQQNSNKKYNYKSAIPAYLLEREQVSTSKSLSTLFKQKRIDKMGKWDVPINNLKRIADEDIFVAKGSTKNCKTKWKKVVTKATFVNPSSTRKLPKYEKFIRPTSLRMSKANVTNPELRTTFRLEILKVNTNPNGQMYTGLGIITRGTIIEVNVSELGLITTTGKIVCGKHAQVTNNPENDGFINAVLLN